jgi:chlorophyllide a oxygenase
MFTQVVDVLNPMAREWKSVKTLREELAELQKSLSKAHEQVL